jgi:hypothetical protein
MNKIILLLMLLPVIITGCKNDDDPAPVPAPSKGNVVFVFKNEADGLPIQTGNINITNEAGNVYSVDILKYYISNITFIKSDGTEFKAPNYELIIQDSAQTNYFTVADVPFGNYTSLRFFMGVDSTINTIGALTGDLDPVNGMFWDWQSGYINFKHEGKFINTAGNIDDLIYHYGTLKSLVTEEIPFNFNFSSATKVITITFNLNKIYRSPNMIDFNGENIHQSTGPGENGWVQLIRENFQGAFEITSVL